MANGQGPATWVAKEGDRATLGFLQGGGEMGALMRAHDWATTPLGPCEDWPQSLRSAVSILLPSNAQICLFWGPELVAIYNDAYRPALGIKHPWALGRPGREVWSELWQDVLSPLLDQVRTTGEGFWRSDFPFFLERHGYPEETYFDISYDPVRDESGAVGGIFCIVSETTGRVVGERRLRTLRLVGEVAAEAQSTAQAFSLVARALEQNSEDLPFALLYDAVLDANAPRLAAGCGFATGPPDNWPFPQVAATRKEFILQGEQLKRLGTLPSGPWPEDVSTVVVLPMLGTGQALIGFLVAGVSARRRLDELYLDFLRLAASNAAAAVGTAHALAEERARALALAELDRAKTLFFSNISHEFRTPLTLMLGPLEDSLADRRERLPPGQRERLELSHRSALRLLKLVNTLLDFSRIEAGRIDAAFEPVDLASVTGELASVFRSAVEKAGLEFVVDCQSLPEPIFVDRDMWEKIVLNLLSNALKFTFEGKIIVHLRRSKGGVDLLICDTGIGIDAEHLSRLFERFYRVPHARARTHEGSGIGLALVSELVRLHGGQIRVESAPGKGTTFVVSLRAGADHLPRDRVETPKRLTPTAIKAEAYVEEALRWLPEGGAAGVPHPSSPVAEKSLRILLADDNADMRDYVSRLLSEQWTVEAVADGSAALQAALRELPDLVVADVMMPGLDGFTLLRELRADSRTQRVPVILLSARAGEEAKIEGLDAGADDYLIKPFSARELVARARTHLDMSRLRNEFAAQKSEREAWFNLAVKAARQGVWYADPATWDAIGDRNLMEMLGLPPD